MYPTCLLFFLEFMYLPLSIVFVLIRVTCLVQRPSTLGLAGCLVGPWTVNNTNSINHHDTFIQYLVDIIVFDDGMLYTLFTDSHRDQNTK